MRHQLAHSTSTPLIMYWTLKSNNLRYISQTCQIVRQAPKVDISNRLDPRDCSIDESMVLWFREGLFAANEKGASIRGVRCAKCAPSAHGDFAKCAHLPERKHKILVNVSTSSPSYLVLPFLSAWRTSVFELQNQQIESGISLANVGA